MEPCVWATAKQLKLTFKVEYVQSALTAATGTSIPRFKERKSNLTRIRHLLIVQICWTIQNFELYL